MFINKCDNSNVFPITWYIVAFCWSYHYHSLIIHVITTVLLYNVYVQKKVT